jgi:hypothetical protein
MKSMPSAPLYHALYPDVSECAPKDFDDTIFLEGGDGSIPHQSLYFEWKLRKELEFVENSLRCCLEVRADTVRIGLGV